MIQHWLVEIDMPSDGILMNPISVANGLVKIVLLRKIEKITREELMKKEYCHQKQEKQC